MGDQWELCNQDRIGGSMRWGTNENCITRITLGDQWDGGPMRTGLKGLDWGDQWDGGTMRTVKRGLHWGTNEMGDQWELYNQGYIVGPMRWGTNENRVERVTRGDQWEWGHRVQTMRRGLMNWGTSRWEGTNGMGDQWDGGPLEWAVRGC